MALYEVTGPDGKVYEVEGPEGATDAQVVSQVRRHIRREKVLALGTQPEAAEPERSLGGYAAEVAKGIPAGIAGLLETGALGASALLPDGAEQSAQASIKDVGKSVQDYLAPSAGYEDSIIRKGAEALGSTIPFLAAAPLGIAGTVGAVGLGVAAGAGEAQQRAEAAGATPEEVSQAMPMGALVGATEFIAPFRIFKRAVGDELAGGVVNYLKRVASAAGEEGLQEAGANIAQNLISRGLYDPEQGVFTNSGESLGYGAGVGGLLQGILEMVAGRRMRGPGPEQEEPQQQDMFGDDSTLPPPTAPPGDIGAPELSEEREGAQEPVQGEMFGPKGGVLSKKAQFPEAPVVAEQQVAEQSDAIEQAQLQQAAEQEAAAEQAKGEQVEEETKKATIAEGLAPQGELFAKKHERTPAEADVISGMGVGQDTVPVEELIKLGIPRAAPVLKRIAGFARNDPRVAEELSKYAARAPENVAPLVTSFVENLDAKENTEEQIQGQMFGPKGGVLRKKAQLPEKPAAVAAPAAPVVEETELTKDEIAALRSEPEPNPYELDGEINALPEEEEAPDELAPAKEKVDVKPVAKTESPAAVLEAPAGVAVEETEPAAVAAKPAGKPAVGKPAVERPDVTARVAPAAKEKTEAKKEKPKKPEFRGATETPEIASDSKAAKAVAKALEIKGEAKPIQRKAETYFNKFNRIADAIHVLGADLVLTRGQTQRKAQEVMEWVEQNLPAEVNEALRNEIRKFSAMEQRGTVESSRRDKMTAVRKASEKQGKDYKKTDEEEMATTPETRRKPKKEKAQKKLETPRELAKAINEVEEAPEPADYDAEQAQYEQEKFGSGEYYGPAMGNRRAPLHPLALHALEEGDLAGALDVLTQHSNTRIANVARALKEKLGSTTVEVEEDFIMSGFYNAKTDRIVLNGEKLSPHVLLHEVTHALTIKNLKNKGHPATIQLDKLYNDVKDYLGTAYGAQSLEEFVAEAFSSPEFQTQLQAIHPDGTEITAWQKFKNIIGNMLRRLVGLSAKPIGSAQDTADDLINQILEPNPNGGSEVLYGPSPTALDKMGEWVDNNASAPTKANLAYVKGWLDQTGSVVREFAMDLLPLNAVADIVEKNIPQAKQLFKVLEDMAGSRQTKTGVVRNTHHKFTKLLDTPVKREQLNTLVTESTRAEVDPSDANGAKKYAGNKDRLADYQRLRKDFTAAPKEVQETYTALRDSYMKQYDELLDVIGNRIDSAIDDPAQRKSMRQKILGEIVSKGKVEPYFPLYRRGNYWLSYRAPDPVSGNIEFYVEAFENAGDRAKAAQLLRTDPKVQATEIEEYQNFKQIDLTRVPTSFVYQIVKELKLHNLPQDAMDSVMEVFMSAMPETAFVQSFRKRAGTLGFQKDALSVFEERGTSLAQQIVSMQYDAKLQKLTTEINETASKSNDEGVHADAYRLRDYISFARNPKIETWGKVLKSIGFGMTLGFNVSSVLVNASNVPVVVLPYLGGRFGYGKATGAIGQAYKLYMGTGFSRDVETLVPVPDGKGGYTNKYAKTSGWSLHNVDYDAAGLPKEIKELRELSDLLVQRGQVTQSMAADALDFDDKSSSILTKVNSLMGFMFHHGERMNRQVTAIAAYKLRLEEMKAKKGSLTQADRQEAAEFAVSATELTNSGALLTTAPRFSQKSTLRNIMFMYKRFGVSMLYHQLKMANEALRSTDKETRRIAKRQVIGLYGSAAVFAGLQGVPMYGLVRTIANLMFVDDDEEDFDTQMLKFVGEPMFSGAINAITGTDVAARIGMTNLVFRSQPNQEQDSAVLYAMELLGGPVLGTASRVEDGVKLIQDGEIGRGFERMLPAFASSVMRGARYAEEGTTTLRGDPISGEVSPQHYMAQMLGFAPADYTRQLEINAVNKKIDRNVNEKRTTLLRRYYVALRNYDTETMQDVMTEILELNKDHPNAAINYQTIERSIAQHAATSQVARKYGGVTINRNMQAEIDRMNAEYGDE